MGGFKIILLLFAFVLSCAAPDVGLGSNSVSKEVSYVSFYSNSTIAKSRNSTVQIFSYDDMGNQVSGTGSYLVYKKKHFILTATHVIKYSSRALIISGNEEIIAKVVYADGDSDIALLSIEGMMTREALSWKTTMPKIGDKTYYTGFPNNYEYLTVDGIISGQTSDHIVLHSYAWPGASGSTVLDSRGRIIGVVSAIDIGYAYLGIPQLVPDVVLVSPIVQLDIEQVVNSL